MPQSETEIVTAAVARMFRARRCLVFGQTRSGPGSLQPTRILDLCAVEFKWAGFIHGIEVKVGRSDFTGDRKWVDYLPMCNRFWWACPTKLIQKNEIDPVVGLIWYEPDSRECRIVKWAKLRPIEPNWRVLLGLVWRGRAETRQERMDRITCEMEHRQYVGAQYREFVSKRLTLAAKRERTLQDEVTVIRNELYNLCRAMPAPPPQEGPKSERTELTQ